jgi:hypothetical protein
MKTVLLGTDENNRPIRFVRMDLLSFDGMKYGGHGSIGEKLIRELTMMAFVYQAKILVCLE